MLPRPHNAFYPLASYPAVGGALAAPRLFTCGELRGKRATSNQSEARKTGFSQSLPRRATTEPFPSR